MRSLVVLSMVLIIVVSDNLYTLAQGEVIPHYVAAWLVRSPPKLQSPPWYIAHNSDYAWRVALEDGQVIAEDTHSKAAPNAALPFPITDKITNSGVLHFFKVDDGWLIGSHRGEWGGDLWWYSSDGAKRYKISSDRVTGFARTPAGLFAFAGLNHLTSRYGTVRRLTQEPRKHWIVHPYVDLTDEPDIAMVEKDASLLIATPFSLVRIKPDKRVQTLVTKAFWWGLSPRSIVETPTGVIYLGMKYGVARILPQQQHYKVEWLLPNQAFADGKAEMPKQEH